MSKIISPIEIHPLGNYREEVRESYIAALEHLAAQLTLKDEKGHYSHELPIIISAEIEFPDISGYSHVLLRLNYVE